MASPDDIKTLVIKFVNAPNSGFKSIQTVKEPITPTLDSLPDFDGFVASLAAAMNDGGARFTAFPDELIKCKTWNNVVSQIVLNQA